MSEHRPSRRTILKAAGGLTVAAGLSAGTILATSSAASAADDGHGLHIVNRGETDPRMWFYRFQTAELSYEPAVNVLLPEDYHTSGGDTRSCTCCTAGCRTSGITFEGDILGLDRGQADRRGDARRRNRRLVLNPVSYSGPKNWETFHMNQLLPWIEANFRTYAEYDGRAVSGFSMGGFGALKYTAKYFGHFASVSAHSGPASLRRDGGLVVHWASAKCRGRAERRHPLRRAVRDRGAASPPTTRSSASTASAASASSWSPAPARVAIR